ncbi:Hypothetical protein GLP15_3015 [Giardia lamblia P15]|uniref:EF-hand domain-containing protein n=1 Tax=Giardia intestinalis (strain P15) TaxID=658858 RepID=E1F6P8_GIAIA|nr:Hypothetical protein GLP15_3015 [Giardia lamblia P15]
MKQTAHLGRSVVRPEENGLENMVYNHANGRAEMFRKEFQLLDFGNTGLLSEARFKAALRNAGFSAPGHMIQKAIKMTANYKANAIDYEKFLKICGLTDNEARPSDDLSRTDNTSLNVSKSGSSMKKVRGSSADSDILEMPDQFLTSTENALRRTIAKENQLDAIRPAGVRSLKTPPSSRTGDSAVPLLASASLQGALNKQELEGPCRRRSLSSKTSEDRASDKTYLKLDGAAGTAQKIFADHLSARGNISKTFRTRFDIKNRGYIDEKDFIFGLRYSGLPSELISDKESLVLFTEATKHKPEPRMTLVDFERLLTRIESIDTVSCFDRSRDRGSGHSSESHFIGDNYREIAKRVSKGTADIERDIALMEQYPEELEQEIEEHRRQTGRTYQENPQLSAQVLEVRLESDKPEQSHSKVLHCNVTEEKEEKDWEAKSDHVQSEQSFQFSTADGSNVSQYSGSSYRTTDTNNRIPLIPPSVPDSVLVDTLKRKIQTAIENKYPNKQAAMVAASSPSRSISDASVFQFLHRLLPDATDHQIRLVMEHVQGNDSAQHSSEHMGADESSLPRQQSCSRNDVLENSTKNLSMNSAATLTVTAGPSDITTVSKKRSTSAKANTYSDLFAPPDEECSRRKREDDAIWAKVMESKAIAERVVEDLPASTSIDASVSVPPHQRQQSRRSSEGTRQDHISIIMNPKANVDYRAPSYTGMSTANTHKKCDSSGLMSAITTSVTPQSPSERKASRRAKSNIDNRSRYNSETLEATIKHVQEPVSGTPRGFQNIKKSLLEGMHGKKVALAECIVTAAAKSKDAYDFRTFISDFTNRQLDNRQLDTLVRCSLDPDTQKISAERVLRNLNLTTEGLYNLPTISHASGDLSDGMVLQPAHRQSLSKTQSARSGSVASVLRGTVLESYINNESCIKTPQMIEDFAPQGKYDRFVNRQDNTSSRYENSTDPHDKTRTTVQEQMTKSNVLTCYETVSSKDIIEDRISAVAMPTFNSHKVHDAMTTLDQSAHRSALACADQEFYNRTGSRPRPNSTRRESDTSLSRNIMDGFSRKSMDDPDARVVRRHSDIRQRHTDIFGASEASNFHTMGSSKRHYHTERTNDRSVVGLEISQVEDGGLTASVGATSYHRSYSAVPSNRDITTFEGLTEKESK